MAVPLEEVYRHPLEEYHRLIEAGAFEDSRVELLEGLLAVMSPKTPAHERAVQWLNIWLARNVDVERYALGVSSPLTLISGSEPEPDFYVCDRAGPRPYHPASAALVIEVAVSSLPRDLVLKPRLYAVASVAEYWVLDLEGRRMIVHRRPEGDRYAEIFTVTAGQELTAVALDLPPLDLDEFVPKGV